MDDRYIPQSYKPHKTLENVGWAFLMFGILIEIVAAGRAVKDQWENDSRNLPVESVTAEARLLIASDNTARTLWLGPAQNCTLECEMGEGSSQQSAFLLTGTSCEIEPNLFAPTSTAFCVIEFRSFSTNSWVFQFQAPQHQPKGPVKDLIKTMHSLYIMPMCLPQPSRIISGQIALTLNGSVTKYFVVIPAEYFPPKGGYGLYATNNTINPIP